MNVWTREEVELTVADYFTMLDAELSGEQFNKASHRKTLVPRLNGRTESAVELKHQNISSVLDKHNFPYVVGYKPRGHYQALLEEIVLLYADRHSINHLDNAQIKYPIRAHSWEVFLPPLQ